MIGLTSMKTNISPDTICKKINSKISDEHCLTISEGLSDCLTNLIHRNVDNNKIKMPSIVCTYLKGPNIYNKKLESKSGFSFLKICKPPLTSVPMIISINNELLKQ